jgi:CheY-like chemotaxis protein
MKRDTSLKQIPVVILTSSTKPEDVAQSYELGANAYIQKPLELEDFFAMVHELIAFWYKHTILPSNANLA